MFCVKCGKNISDGYTFCPWCGQPVFQVEQNGVDANSYMNFHTDLDLEGFSTSVDDYEEVFSKKKEKEDFCTTVVGVIWLVLSLVPTVRNWDYWDKTDIIAFWVVTLIVCSLINYAVCALFGVNDSEKQLDEYRKLKTSTGKKNAILIMEMKYSKRGGCFGAIVGFAITVLLIIFLISLC